MYFIISYHLTDECPAGEERNAENTGCQACGEDSIKPDTLPEVAECTACEELQHGNSDRTECFGKGNQLYFGNFIYMQITKKNNTKQFQFS